MCRAVLLHSVALIALKYDGGTPVRRVGSLCWTQGVAARLIR
jgi:hypothetical protein